MRDGGEEDGGCGGEHGEAPAFHERNRIFDGFGSEERRDLLFLEHGSTAAVGAGGDVAAAGDEAEDPVEVEVGVVDEDVKWAVAALRTGIGTDVEEWKCALAPAVEDHCGCSDKGSRRLPLFR